MCPNTTRMKHSVPPSHASGKVMAIDKAKEPWCFLPRRSEALGAGLARPLLFTEGGWEAFAPSTMALTCPRAPGAGWGLQATSRLEGQLGIGNGFPFSLRSPGVQLLSYLEGKWYLVRRGEMPFFMISCRGLSANGASAGVPRIPLGL